MLKQKKVSDILWEIVGGVKYQNSFCKKNDFVKKMTQRHELYLRAGRSISDKW